MIIPNVLIAGAPKCGTTSLFSYLGNHPDVCPASEKETCFLLDRDHPRFRSDWNVHRIGLRGYARFFSACEKKSYRVYLEATPFYLYQETAWQTIGRMSPRPQIVFLLRRPTERVYSIYKFAKGNISCIPANMSFMEFVRCIDGGHFTQDQYEISRAVEHSHYSKFLKNWMLAVGRDRINIVLLEELARNPKRSLIKLATDLHLDASFYDEYVFQQYNKSFKVRLQRLQRLKRKCNRYWGEKGSLYRVLRGLYRWINVIEETKELQEEPLARRLLDTRFKEEIVNLEDLLGLELKEWK